MKVINFIYNVYEILRIEELNMEKITSYSKVIPWLMAHKGYHFSPMFVTSSVQTLRSNFQPNQLGL